MELITTSGAASAVDRDPAQSKRLPAFAALAALLVGLVLYLVDRQGDAYFLALPLHLKVAPLFGAAGGCLPSFLHCYALALLTALCLPSSRRWSLFACGCWLLINGLFEIGQHPLLGEHLARRVPAWFDHVPFLEAAAGYFGAGVYDPLDIAAAAMGAVAAWLTLQLTRKRTHDNT